LGDLKVAKAAKVSVRAPAGLAGSTALVWVNAGCIFLIVASAFGVIQSSHACRQLYAQLQILEASRWYMEEDFGRLLLEQSTWASYHRIERVAGRELNMQPPAISDLRVINQ
jgi:cell division protein FtsL